MIRYLLCCMFFAITMTIGCAPAGPQKFQVEGRVTLDGEPIESGHLWFRDKSGQTGSVEARITAGVYQLESLPGEKLVEISMLKDVPLPGGKPNTEGDTTTKVEAIPERYNVKTELEVTVSADLKTQDFALTTKR